MDKHPEQGGLTRSRLASDDDDSLTVFDSVTERSVRFLMRRVGEEEARIRR
jgi:hypothetical protein